MILMLVISILLGVLLAQFTSPFLAIVLSIVFLLGWMAFNVRAAEHGIAKANTKTYFILRSRGVSHYQALFDTASARYPHDPFKAVKVTYAAFAERSETEVNNASQDQKREDLINLVTSIYREEVPRTLELGRAGKTTGIIIDTIVNKMHQFGGSL